MKRKYFLLLIIMLSPFIGGIYGILHDQITFTISPEYYTKFKFYQFGFARTGEEWVPGNIRFYVSLVGFLATWWVGLIIGSVLALAGLIHQDRKRMVQITFKAILITLLIAAFSGFIGFTYSLFPTDASKIAGWVPTNIVGKQAFYSVACIHTFSYLGGLIGLIAGSIYSIKKK